MKKVILVLSFCAFLFAVSVFGFNHFTLSKSMSEVIESDFRNKDIQISVHYENYVNLNVLVFDVSNIRMTHSAADIFRVFWAYSNKMKDKSFDKVILSSKGKAKFYILGKHFKSIGNEYGVQNPIYIIRTFPENVYKLDGSKAFSGWTGDLLGVAQKQLEDFNEMSREWFLHDALK